MSSHRTGAMREDAALVTLKKKLSVPATNTNTNDDGYLLRYLRETNLDVEAAIEKLRARRKFERTFLAISSSPYLVRALRSGAFAVLGNDILGRPVLYIRMAFYYPSDDPLENSKLATFLLEYMASLAYACNMSEITVLVNEESAGWFAHHNTLLQEIISNLVSNYYPELVALVLVAGAAWNIAKGVKSRTSNANAKNKIKLVNKSDLLRNLHATVIPQELGGRSKVGMAMQEFSESVMKYWYSVTSCLEAEKEGMTRPLWQQLACVATLSPSQQAERRAMLLRGSKAPRRAQLLRNVTGVGSSSMAGSSSAQSGGGLGGGGGMAFPSDNDDGVCSVISDMEVGAGSSEDGTEPGVGSEDDEEAVNPKSKSKDLTAMLEAERRQRVKLETEVAKLKLGVSIDETQLTPLEGKLRQAHEEVNILISESISRARNHSAPNEPTLGQLLEICDAAILHEIQERQTVPAMHFAQPTERKPKSSCCLM